MKEPLRFHGNDMSVVCIPTIQFVVESTHRNHMTILLLFRFDMNHL
jgi:hypothetical protein